MTTALTIALFLFDAGVGEFSLVFDAAFVLAGLAETRFRTLGLREVLLRMRSPGKLRVRDCLAFACPTIAGCSVSLVLPPPFWP